MVGWLLSPFLGPAAFCFCSAPRTSKSKHVCYACPYPFGVCYFGRIRFSTALCVCVCAHFYTVVNALASYSYGNSCSRAMNMQCRILRRLGAMPAAGHVVESLHGSMAFRIMPPRSLPPSETPCHMRVLCHGRPGSLPNAHPQIRQQDKN
ncbi:hypothetical protein F4780DRAFT_736886 [Xylariomycetidae sp. FL0641]|nr:hypothetical protein F4780DRAFT_736886 [Xylariomycetidae sp. FL0641]